MTSSNNGAASATSRLSTARAKLTTAAHIAEQFGTTPAWVRQELIAAGLRWTEGPRGTVLLNPEQEAAFWKSRERTGDEGVAQVAYPVASEPQLTRDGKKPRIPAARPRRLPAQRSA